MIGHDLRGGVNCRDPPRIHVCAHPCKVGTLPDGVPSQVAWSGVTAPKAAEVELSSEWLSRTRDKSPRISNEPPRTRERWQPSFGDPRPDSGDRTGRRVSTQRSTRSMSRPTLDVLRGKQLGQWERGLLLDCSLLTSTITVSTLRGEDHRVRTSGGPPLDSSSYGGGASNHLDSIIERT